MGRFLLKSLGWCLAVIATSVLICMLLLYVEKETSSAVTTWSDICQSHCSICHENKLKYMSRNMVWRCSLHLDKKHAQTTPTPPLLRKSDRLQVEKWSNSLLMNWAWDKSKSFRDVQITMGNGVCWREPQSSLEQPCSVCGTYGLPYLPPAFLGRNTPAHVSGWHMHRECDGDGDCWLQHAMATWVLWVPAGMCSAFRHAGLRASLSSLSLPGMCWAFWTRVPHISDRCREYPQVPTDEILRL